MKICQVRNYTAPAKDSMGAERLVERLSKGLVRQGHTVYMKLSDQTVSSPVHGAILVKYIPDDVDIIHFHDWEPVEWSRDIKKPWCTTIHGYSLHQYPELAVNNPRVIAVSKFAAEQFSATRWVHNFSDPEEFSFEKNKEDYFLWMAGTDWQAGNDGKGLWKTIQLAKKLRFKLKIAGTGQNKQVIDYIKSLCDDRIEYIGAVNGRQKVDVLKKAKALILLTQLPDACPTTVSEALMCGTPVIGSDKGSMPELIDNGITGFICKNDQDFAKAILCIQNINVERCAEEAIKNYSIDTATLKYIDIYKNLVLE